MTALAQGASAPGPIGPLIALVVQGPLYENLNGHSTIDILRALARSPLRDRFHVVCSLWDTESGERLEAIRPFVDDIVQSAQPEAWGSGNRNLQRQGVSAALDRLAERGIPYVLKTRSDFLLSETLLRAVVERASAGFDRILVTNIFTRFEPFHISDMLLFARFSYMRHWFDPREVYYQDLYSPEVQFARVFVRNMGLGYPMTQQGYLRFLRDWIDLIDFNQYGLTWFKFVDISLRTVNAGNWVIYDRDCGPVLTKVLSASYGAFLRRTRLPLLVLATWLTLHDTLKRFVVMAGSSFLERVLHLRIYHGHIRFPGGRLLEVRIGASPHRFSYYNVDPLGRECAAPVGGRPRLPPPTPRAPEPEPRHEAPWFRVPFLAMRVIPASSIVHHT